MSLSRYRTFPTIFKYGGPSPTVRHRWRRATEHTQRLATIFSVRSSRLGSAGVAGAWMRGSGLVSRAAVLTMPQVSTSSTSRVPSSRGVAAEGWPCASVLVWGDFIQVHTGWPDAFSQRGEAAFGQKRSPACSSWKSVLGRTATQGTVLLAQCTPEDRQITLRSDRPRCCRASRSNTGTPGALYPPSPAPPHGPAPAG